jgi:NAD(P)-dependent dehydrogenase (short-subunit alcohol dehydrogenase family)
LKKAVIIGVGPDAGLGARLCRRFARLGLHVFAAGRTARNLDELVAAIEADGGDATAVVADATDEASVVALFERAAAAPGDAIDLAIYNAGNNTPGRIAEMTAAYFERAWRVGCFGGFLFGREAVRRMVPAGSGTLLFTGASASLRGRANFGAFNSAKGALRNLAQAMAKEYGAQGIHVGHVVVDGAIGGEKIRRGLPEYAAKLGEEGMIDLDGIADGFAYLYQQRRTAWSFELDVRTAKEAW